MINNFGECPATQKLVEGVWTVEIGSRPEAQKLSSQFSQWMGTQWMGLRFYGRQVGHVMCANGVEIGEGVAEIETTQVCVC